MTTERLSADTSTNPPPVRHQHNGWRTFGIIVITIAVTLAVGYWAVTTWLFPTEFKPVVLNQEQQKTLDRKIKLLGGSSRSNEERAIEPEAYSEVGASREVEFSERELNALLAKILISLTNWPSISRTTWSVRNCLWMLIRIFQSSEVRLSRSLAGWNYAWSKAGLALH